MSQRYPDAISMSRYASGIIYHALGKPKESCIIWFREEVEKTVNWAGNPNTAVQKKQDTKSLSPRASFEIWKEKVKYNSLEWRVSELNAANRFASALQGHFYTLNLQEEDFNLRMLNDKLQKANQELSNINWITSHDLKEPLRKIQLFATKIMDKDDQAISDVIKESINKIHKSANRMQHLVDDILSYSLSSDKNKNFEVVDPGAILNDIKDSLTDELAEGNIKFIVNNVPSAISVVPFQFKQMISNLVGNSIKFADKSRAGTININFSRVNGMDIP
ncbi:MAG: histidine kinase, partial [Pedobacter sp.]